MRALLNTFLIAGSFSLCLHADEIIPGVLSINLKNFNEFVQVGDTNDHSFYGISQPCTFVFQSDNNDGRRISVRMRSVGITTKEGGRLSYRQCDESALKEELTNTVKPPSSTDATPYYDINIVSPAANTTLGGTNAISITFNYLRKDGKFLGLNEIYWVRVQTNSVVEVVLNVRSNSEEQIDSLRKCLSSFKIKPKF